MKLAKNLIKWAKKNRCLHPFHPCQNGAMPPLVTMHIIIQINITHKQLGKPSRQGGQAQIKIMHIAHTLHSTIHIIYKAEEFLPIHVLHLLCFQISFMELGSNPSGILRTYSQSVQICNVIQRQTKYIIY